MAPMIQLIDGEGDFFDVYIKPSIFVVFDSEEEDSEEKKENG